MADRQTIFNCAHLFTLISFSSAALLQPAALPSYAGDDLKLRPGVSFTQDLDNGFPIEGTNLDDCKVSTTTPTLVFFGASGDLNTNRQAKRVVYLYKKVEPRKIKFVIVDVDHPANDEAKALIKTHYRGYIPQELLLDKTGKVVWNHDGEIEFNLLKAQVDKVTE